MDREVLEKFLKKKVIIYLENRIHYTGVIVEIYSTSLLFVDKYGAEIAIPYERIERVMEINETNRKNFK